MLSFENDYNRGAHPEILRRLVETNMDMEVGYLIISNKNIWNPCKSVLLKFEFMNE